MQENNNQSENNNENLFNNQAMQQLQTDFNNKQKKTKRIVKFVFAVKAAVAFIITHIYIFIAIFIAVLIASAIHLVVNNKTNSAAYQDKLNSSASAQTGGLDITSESWRLLEKEIEDFIKNYDDANEALRQKMLDKIDDIYNWQENSGYSAAVLITIAFEDGIAAEGFEDFLNEMNTNGQKWKDEGYTTVSQIAKDYVGDDTAEEWANNIENKIQQEAIDSGIVKYGEQKAEGKKLETDGYNTIYISKSGKKYLNYKQINGWYAHENWIQNWDEYDSKGNHVSTIYWSACPIVSATIIISGYTNIERDPMQIIYSFMGSNRLLDYAHSPNEYLSRLGVTSTRRYTKNTTELSAGQKQEILNVLRANKPVIIHVLGRSNGGRSRFTNSEHWMVLLDYYEETNEVYVSNPSANSKDKTGRLPVDDVLTSCCEFIEVQS